MLKCDEKARKCLVKFEDDFECWLEATQLHIQLAIESLEDEQIVCCICDQGESEQLNELIICDSCQQGFHVKCHQPEIDRKAAKLDDEDTEWICATCKQLIGQQRRHAKPAAKAKKINKMRRQSSASAERATRKLPKVKLTTVAKEALATKISTSNGKPDQDLTRTSGESNPDKGSVDARGPQQVDNDPNNALIEKESNVQTDDFVKMVAADQSSPIKKLDISAKSCRPTTKLSRKMVKAAAF